MKINLAIAIGLCLFSTLAHADSWGAMHWGQNPWGADAAPEATYENTGLLKLQNVDVNGQHYYVELQNKGLGGAFEFALGLVQPLDHAASQYQTTYNAGKSELNIPHVYAGGQYYAVNMQNDSLFIFRIAGPVISVKSRKIDSEIADVENEAVSDAELASP